jgi:hypothetical protein
MRDLLLVLGVVVNRRVAVQTVVENHQRLQRDADGSDLGEVAFGRIGERLKKGRIRQGVRVGAIERRRNVHFGHLIRPGADIERISRRAVGQRLSAERITGAVHRLPRQPEPAQIGQVRFLQQRQRGGRRRHRRRVGLHAATRIGCRQGLGGLRFERHGKRRHGSGND